MTKIRKAVLSDLDILIEMNSEIQRLHQKAEPSIFRKPSRSAIGNFLKECLKDRMKIILVAECEAEVVGYILLEIHKVKANPFQKAHSFLYIDHICVIPRFRRAGLAMELMKAARSVAKTRRLERLVLDYWVFNSRAAGFFTAAGFRPWLGRMMAKVR